MYSPIQQLRHSRASCEYWLTLRVALKLLDRPYREIHTSIQLKHSAPVTSMLTVWWAKTKSDTLWKVAANLSPTVRHKQSPKRWTLTEMVSSHMVNLLSLCALRAHRADSDYIYTQLSTTKTDTRDTQTYILIQHFISSQVCKWIQYCRFLLWKKT